MTFPGRKSLYRYFDAEGNFFRDGILLEHENPDSCDFIYNPIYPDKWTRVAGLRRELLHQKVYENNEISQPLPDPLQCQKYLFSRAASLPPEHKRFIMPHIYKVGGSTELLNLRDQTRRKIGENFSEN